MVLVSYSISFCSDALDFTSDFWTLLLIFSSNCCVQSSPGDGKARFFGFMAAVASSISGGAVLGNLCRRRRPRAPSNFDFGN
jgi:hypothetical protein